MLSVRDIEKKNCAENGKRIKKPFVSEIFGEGEKLLVVCV